jgi:hypothetical protein
MNRQQRRLQAKTMRKAETMSSQLNIRYQQELIAERMKDQEEIEKYRCDNITEDWHWFYGIMGITLAEKYHWNSDKILSLFEKCDQTVDQAVKNSQGRDDIANKFQELTGITLALK